MPSLVAIDIETTGLDVSKDAIIEIAAVRFNERRVEAEFSSLVNPTRIIPSEISRLTGITNEMVRNAPKIHSLIDEFASFVGDSPVLGHNVRFDLSFLQRLGILSNNEPVDTYELAAVILPRASRYNLEALAQLLGIYYHDTHRALPDAQITRLVYLQLFEKCLELPFELVEEIIRASESSTWDGNWLFREALRIKAQKAFTEPLTDLHGHDAILPVPEIYSAPLAPLETPLPLEIEEVTGLLEHGGQFSHHFSSYEYRPQQVEMLRVVTRAIVEGQHLMVEAGTGTGKSFAYLIPAALWALKNRERVIISTNTINLQDQLIKKDIPDLCAALKIDLRTTVLKGRSNYLCPRRFESFRNRSPQNNDEMRVLGKALIWLHEGGSGDRNEINLNGPLEKEIWNQFSSEDEGCKDETCIGRMGATCPFYRIHLAAQNAHLIVVNHALLLADVATGSRILPDYSYLIIDEAHHVESATTSALSFRVTESFVSRLLRELGGSSSGILGHLLSQLKILYTPADFASADQTIRHLTDLTFRLEHDFKQFFESVDHFLKDAREYHEINPYGQQTRIVPSTRKLPQWEEVEISWSVTEETMKVLLSLTSQLYNSVGEARKTLPDEVYDALDNLGNQYQRLLEAYNNLNAFVSKPNDNSIYWAEISPNGNQIALEVAPLHIGELMEKHLWHEKKSIVLTSATLTTNTGFDYLRGRLNADEADELAVGSPFDYENSALLYLVNDIPEPTDKPRYQRAVEDILIKVSKATGGKMLVLFTSYSQLKQTAQAISPYLEEQGIFIYEQGKGASPNVLLENFRSAEKAVLLGTRSFWEGVDIPGEALSVLVIVKLPFDVPSDPIIAARSEMFDDPFNEYNLPEAVLRFRQGFGRLIRTQNDRGVVIVLDRRILTKKYGKAFLDALPECTAKVDSMLNVVKATTSWLNL